jgi:hypothetical protein
MISNPEAVEIIDTKDITEGMECFFVKGQGVPSGFKAGTKIKITRVYKGPIAPEKSCPGNEPLIHFDQHDGFGWTHESMPPSSLSGLLALERRHDGELSPSVAKNRVEECGAESGLEEGKSSTRRQDSPEFIAGIKRIVDRVRYEKLQEMLGDAEEIGFKIHSLPYIIAIKISKLDEGQFSVLLKTMEASDSFNFTVASDGTIKDSDIDDGKYTNLDSAINAAHATIEKPKA